MTPAANERRLAGRYIVWWRHESHSVVSAGGVTVARQYRKIWRYGQVRNKAAGTLWTKRSERVPVSDASVVDEIEWPKYPDGGYKAITQAEFDELMTGRATDAKNNLSISTQL